jgi:GntR family transcriptional regulator, rspAB operon transcriptional repressor
MKIGKVKASGENDAGLNAAVYEKIKTEILERRVRPGVKLTHQGIAQLLGVSRTPVRVALERLLQDGFVYRLPRRGFFVAEIGTEEVQHLYETREALEIYQLNRLFDRGISRGELSKLRAINLRYGKLIAARLSYERLMVDRQFHLELAGISGNTILLRTLDGIFEKLILKRRLEGMLSDPTGKAPYEDHVKLLGALSDNNRQVAVSTLQKHIRGACTRLLNDLRSFDPGGGALQPVALRARVV